MMLLMFLFAASASPTPVGSPWPRAAYVSEGVYPAAPPMREAIGARLRLELVDHPRSTADLGKPVDYARVCRETRLPLLVTSDATTTFTFSPRGVQLELKAMVYDCARGAFVASSEAKTSAVPAADVRTLSDQYPAALAALLSGLVVRTAVATPAPERPSYPLDVPTAFPAPAGPPQRR
jgi:hypothetical protein